MKLHDLSFKMAAWEDTPAPAPAPVPAPAWRSWGGVLWRRLGCPAVRSSVRISFRENIS